MQRKLILGNWKMHGSTESNAALLAAIRERMSRENTNVDVGVCVPAIFVEQARSALQGSAVAWGVQDVSAHVQGAFTGEISAAMVAGFQATFAIVGHSERRANHGETALVVGEKARQALVAGLVPVVCVGETLAEREAGATDAVVRAQLAAVLEAISVDDAKKIVVAYEPVWAIGTGRSASVDEAQATHAGLRSVLREYDAGLDKLRILYGGSIKPDNASALLDCDGIDGGLIGGASLKSADFISIIEAAASLHADDSLHVG